MFNKYKKIGILKYFSSNYFSLVSALKKISVEYQLSSNFKDLINNDKIIIPGVGNMRYFFNSTTQDQLTVDINSYIMNSGKLLGICLGMQAFLENSEESKSKTLGVIKGKTLSLQKDFNLGMNVGFKKLLIEKESEIMNKLLNGIDKDERFYFLHKYHCLIEDQNVLKVYSKFENKKIVSLIQKKNIIGTQFHPELSGKSGLKFLKNFSNLQTFK
tara:strand:- start:485 stop:1129 length:645 start_codon:yes stop_codon:yes gene_type:complete